MLNILLTGVGGQGTVLAAKVLAQAALEKGWQVRTAETIGIAQRGGNVVSHVRIGNKGEQVHAPLVSRGTADLIIAFEPAEAARVLPYLAPAGTLVFATTAVQPVTAALSKNPYRASDVIANMERALAGTQANLVPVDDAALTKAAGSRKVLNSLLLAKALQTGCVPIDVEDLRAAIAACVKPRFVDMNLQAINVAVGEEHRKTLHCKQRDRKSVPLPVLGVACGLVWPTMTSMTSVFDIHFSSAARIALAGRWL